MSLADALGAVDPQGIVNDLITERAPELVQNNAVDPQAVLNRLIRKTLDKRQQQQLQQHQDAQKAQPDFGAFGKTQDEVDKAPAIDFSQYGEAPSDEPPITGTATVGGQSAKAAKPEDVPWSSLPGVAAKSAVQGITGQTGDIMQGAAVGLDRLGRAVTGASGNTAPSDIQDTVDPNSGDITGTATVGATPIEDNALYRAGRSVKQFGEAAAPLSPAEKETLTSKVAGGIGGIAPYVAGGLAAGPLTGLAMGGLGMGLSSAGETFDAAKQKGASDDDAAKAAGLSGLVGGGLGMIPLGSVLAPVKQVAPGLAGWAAATLEHALRDGVVFTGIGEAQDYLNQKIAAAYYDKNAAYTPDFKRMLASYITGLAVGGGTHGLSTFGNRNAAEPAATADQPAAAVSGALPGSEAPGAAAGSGGGPRPGESPGGAGAAGAGARPTGSPRRDDPYDPDYQWGTSGRGFNGTWYRDDAAGGRWYYNPMNGEWDHQAGGDQQQQTGGGSGSAPGSGAQQQQPGEKPQPFETKMGARARFKLEEAAAYYKEFDRDTIRSWNDDDLKDYVNTKFGYGSQRADDDEVLRRYGYSKDDVAGMKPDEKADAVDEALKNGVHAGAEAPQEGTREAPVEVKTADDVARAASVADQDHSPEQGEANNVQRGHMRWNGLDITIEAPAGGVRRGTNPETGEAWQTTHSVPYGYVKGTEGADGMHVDVFMGPNPQRPTVYVLDEKDEATGAFRQHKAMIGFDGPSEAIQAYLGTSSKKPQHIGGMRAMPVGEFKDWLKTGNTKAAASEAMAAENPPETPPETAPAMQAAGTEAGTAHGSPTNNVRAEPEPTAKTTPISGERAGAAPEAGPEHHQAIEDTLRAAGVDPDTVRPADIVRAAEIHANEGAPPDDAFTTAVVRSLVEDGHMSRDEIAKDIGDEATTELLEARDGSERGLGAAASGATTDRATAAGAQAVDQGGVEAARPEEPARPQEPARGEGTGREPQAAATGHPATGAGAGGDTAGGERTAEADDGRTGGGAEAAVEHKPARAAKDAVSGGKPFGGMIANQEAYRARAQRMRDEGRGSPWPTYKTTEEKLRAQGTSVRQDNARRKQEIETQRPIFDAALKEQKIPLDSVPEALRFDAMERMLDRGEDPLDALESVIMQYARDEDMIADELHRDKVEGILAGEEVFNALDERHPPRHGEKPAPERTEPAVEEAAQRAQAGGVASGAGASAGPGRGEVRAQGGKRSGERTQPVTERTAAGQQHVLPGAEQISDAERAQRAADRSLKPKAVQKPADEGLFGDESKQTDLVDLARKPAKALPPVLTSQPPEPADKPADTEAAQARAAGPSDSAPGAKSETRTSAPEKVAKVEDFGEKIGGARKETFAGFRDSLREKFDVAAVPLSKSFPQPDYEKLAAAGVDARVLSHIAIMRDMIPNRPRVAGKAKRWAEQVETLRTFARQLLDGEIDVAKLEQAARGNYALQTLPLTAKAIEDIAPADLPRAARYRVNSGHYSILNGQRYSPSKSFWFLESPDRRSARDPFSNDPANPYTYRDNPEDAVALAKKIIAHDLAEKPTEGAGERSKYTDVGIYRDRETKGAFLGFKVRSTVIRLKAGFETPQAAREYLQENRDDLQAAIDALRKGPNMRGTENRPRSGEALREGDVTPEMFSGAFGFRGVQFGNYVEGQRRQADLNRAFDALMDLADVVGVPPQALSLNGELGLAFGARGHGGRDAASAHYEPGQVVINLTKGGGPGSLAHEWLHALDNYFARQDQASGYISERRRDGGPVRHEVYQAWKNVEASLQKGGFADRAAKFDKVRAKPYWNTTIEKAARSFERYIVDRLADKGAANDYLANIDTAGGAYPTADEMRDQGIRAAYDHLFETIEARPAGHGFALAESEDAFGHAPAFYSAVERAVAAVKQDKAAPNHWLGTIRNAPGVKPEEIEWLGLEHWLREHKGAVTKAEVHDYVRAHQVEVREVEKSDAQPPSDIEDWTQGEPVENDEGGTTTQLTLPGRSTGTGIDVYHDKNGELTGYAAFVRGTMLGDHESFEGAVADLAREIGGDIGGTQYRQYTLPGGENYRELLLTLPEKLPGEEASRNAQVDAWHDFEMEMRRKYGTTGTDDTLAAMSPAERERYAQFDREYRPPSANQDFRSPHFDEPNVLAHIRFNDRTIDGKKTLFIEEVQSDWHQAGKKKGYKQPPQKLFTDSDFKFVRTDGDHGKHWFALPDGSERPGWGDTVDVARAEAVDNYQRSAKIHGDYEQGTRVPDAPFKTTWPELSLKRIIRYAAEHGYDKIAWTPGDVQADRYDLSKQIDDLHYIKGADGHYTIDARLKGRSDNTRIAEGVPEKDLPDHVGKDVAARIAAGEGKPSGFYGTDKGRRTLSGLDLKVGGEGMRGFYDDILPKTANKLVKKYGGKVGQGKLPTVPADFQNDLSRGLVLEQDKSKYPGHTVHTLDIAPALRQAATGQGFALFQPGETKPAKVTAHDLGPIAIPQHMLAGDWAQRHVLRQGIATGLEHLVAVDQNGKVVAHTRGGPGNTGQDLKLFAIASDPRNAIVIHHNHPRDGTLSGPDIGFLGLPGLHAVWAHGHGGHVARAELTPSARAALRRFDPVTAAKYLYAAHEAVQNKLYDIINTALLSGRIDRDTANALLPHAVAVALHRAGIIDYRSNSTFGDDIEKLGLGAYIELAAHAARGTVHGPDELPDDRSAGSLRHAGDLGASFARTAEVAAGHVAAPGHDRVGGADDRAQAARAAHGVGLGDAELAGTELAGTGLAEEGRHYTLGAMGDPIRTIKVFKDFWTSAFQPELVSDRALEADPLFARYKARQAQEKDAVVRQSESQWNYWNKRGDAERIRFLDDVESNNTPADATQADMARRYRRILDANWAEEQRYGSRAAFVDDYFPHIWEQPDEWRAFSETRSAQVGPTWFQKKRTYDYISEGLAAGLKLRFTNPVDIVVHRLLSGVDMRQRMELLYQLKDMGLAWEGKQGGEQLVRRGWRAINAPDRQQWVIVPDVQKLWQNGVEAKGLWQAEHVGGSMFRGWMALKNAWVPIKLALSAFHPLHVLHIDQANSLARAWDDLAKGHDLPAALKAAAEGVGTIPTLGMIHYRKGAKARAAWAKRPSQQTPQDKAVVALMTDGGFVPQLSEQLKIAARRQLAVAWRKVLRGEAGASDWRKAVSAAMRRPIEVLQAPLFEKWIPALKAAAYLDQAASLLKRRPGLLADDTNRRIALRAIAKSIDNRYGEMSYGTLFWNRTTKDAAIGSFLSLGWNLGFVREFGGATLEAGTRTAGLLPPFKPSAGRAVTRDATNKIPFVLAYVGTAALIAGIMTNLFTGKQPEGIDYVFPRAGGENPDGSPRRYTTMFYLREVPMLLKHVQERGGNWLSGAGEMLWNKLMFEPFHELLTNRDYYGYNIWDENAPIYQQVWQGVKHFFGDQTNPMSVSGAKHAAELSGKPFPSAAEAIRHPEQYLDALKAKGVGMSVLGFGPAPAYVEKSPIQNRISYLYREHVAPTSRPEEQAQGTEEKMAVRSAILIAKRDHDSKALQDAYQRGKALGLKPGYMQNVGVVPTDIYLFSRLPNEDQKAILLQASKDERNRYWPKAHQTVKNEVNRQVHLPAIPAGALPAGAM